MEKKTLESIRRTELNVRISPDLLRKLKIKCVEKDVTVTHIVLKLIENFVGEPE